jgi:small subunit ribosomal protein S9
MAAEKEYFGARGARKEATARVRIYKGKGTSTINERPIKEYYPKDYRRKKLFKPLVVTGLRDKVYFTALAQGGGRITGQLDAIVLGLARAIIEMDPTQKPVLAEHGLTTRDPRQKERKKYFNIKARKKPQFSKR